jgi:hypothetical protein
VICISRAFAFPYLYNAIAFPGFSSRPSGPGLVDHIGTVTTGVFGVMFLSWSAGHTLPVEVCACRAGAPGARDSGCVVFPHEGENPGPPGARSWGRDVSLTDTTGCLVHHTHQGGAPSHDVLADNLVKL